MLTLVEPIFTFFELITKGQYMEGHIDKIDVKRDHKELIALFYKIELMHLMQVLLYAQD